MCWDFDALGFLHVVCVVVASRFEGLGLKKEFVVFILSDAIRFISMVPLFVSVFNPISSYHLFEVLSACSYVCVDVVS